MPATVSFDIFREIEDEHRELDRAYASMRSILGTADPNRSQIVRQRFAQLHSLLECHFAREEEDGFFDEILEMAPRFSNRVAALQAEHDELLNRLADFDIRITTTADLLTEYDSFRSDFDEFLAACEEHEACENSLV